MKQEKIVLTPLSSKIKTILVAILALVLFGVCCSLLDLDLPKFMSRLSNTGTVLGKFLVLDFSDLSEILTQLLVSILMSICALVVGVFVSIILAFLAAKNTSPVPFLGTVIKAAISIVRAIPALVWILVIVACFGFGALAGVVGLFLPTLGYLTKSFISSIEELGYDLIEAMRSTGANWFQIMLEGLMPALSTSFLSWIAIRFEINTAESISLGMLGAGGIGTILMRQIAKYNYGAISAIILIIFITMFLIELGVNYGKAQIAKTS